MTSDSSLTSGALRSPIAGEVLRYGLPLVALSGSAALSMLALPRLSGEADAAVVATGVALDLTVTVPALVYLLLVRSKRLPLIALVPAFAAGYVVAVATLPAEHRGVVDSMGMLVFPAEVALVTWLIWMTRRALKSASREGGDAATRFREVARRVLGKRVPADILTTEVMILYHAFRRRRPAAERAGSFTVHREAAYLNLLIALGSVLVVETLAVHVLVRLWSDTVAWVLTGLSLYAIVWIVGDYGAITARPILLTPDLLAVRLGLRWEADIRIDNIEQVEPAGSLDRFDQGGSLERPAGKPGRDVLVAALLGQPNVRINLREPVEVTGMYGLRRSVKEIRVRVDDAHRFREELRGLLAGSGR